MAICLPQWLKRSHDIALQAIQRRPKHLAYVDGCQLHVLSGNSHIAVPQQVLEAEWVATCFEIQDCKSMPEAMGITWRHLGSLPNDPDLST